MASTYLSRTPGSAGNRKTNTTSLWLKRSTLGTSYFNAWYEYGAGKDHINISFQDDQLTVENYTGISLDWKLSSNQVFRDVSAWYHIVIAIDTTQSTSTDRVKMYVNGNQITSFSTSSYPTLNFDTAISQAQTTRLGVSVGGAYYDGSMSHVHFIDGTAYDASTFGETDATTGIWKPKTAPSVTYGSQGYFLKFESSGSMGTDSSPNGNNFTVNGTLTQTVDTPSNVFATLNPLIPNNGTFSNGNLKLATTVSTRDNAPATIGVSQGKWYAEAKLISESAARFLLGVSPNPSELSQNNDWTGNQTDSCSYVSEGSVYKNGIVEYSPSTYTVGDIVGIALDLDNNYVYFHKNGTWQNSGNPESGATGTGGISLTSASSLSSGFYFVTIGDTSTVHNATGEINFGNGYFGTTAVSSATSDESGLGIFEYSVPSGYYCLCTKNINLLEYA
jgi:hypothetical protein